MTKSSQFAQELAGFSTEGPSSSGNPSVSQARWLVTLEQWFFNLGLFGPQGTFGNVHRHF